MKLNIGKISHVLNYSPVSPQMGMVGENSGAKKPCSVPVAAFVIKFDNFGQGG